MNASRLSSRYWSFIRGTMPERAVSRQPSAISSRQPSAVSRRPSAVPGALRRGDAALAGRKARCARGARLRVGAPATRALLADATDRRVRVVSRRSRGDFDDESLRPGVMLGTCSPRPHLACVRDCCMLYTTAAISIWQKGVISDAQQ